eukprot:m.43522 g.43522  ORF g.43522 m.43522 type:complete len:417 (+) comp12931_c0_seq1:90-1340(+)
MYQTAVLYAAMMVLGAVAAMAWSVKTNGEFPLKHAATASLAPTSSNTTASVFITTFAAFDPDASYVLPNYASNFNAASLTTIDTTVVWPNEAAAAPFNTSIITLAGGFFANPGKATGRVSLRAVDAATGAVGMAVQASQDKTGYFYHHVEWTPLSSRLNALVSARVKVPTAGKAQGELVLLTPSSNDYLTASWTESVVATGPDVFFTLADLESKGNTVVIASQYFTAKALMIYDCQGPLVNCSDATVQSYVIDNSEKAGFFSVTYVDVNNDGQTDVLATTNTATGKGGVFVYVAISDYRQGPGAWVKHELATGYVPTLPFLPGRGAPGSISTFAPPSNTMASGKPCLLVSGDDAGTVSVLTPNSGKPSDWGYTQTFIYNTTGTVGSPVAVATAEGGVDVIVPDYAQNKMVWLTLLS